MKIRNNKGFASILEVIITTVIFVIASFGLLTTLSMFRPLSVDSDERLEAAYIGKMVMDQLKYEIDAETWNTGALSIAGSPYSLTVGSFQVVYTVADHPTIPNVREVTMTVTYP